jgi:hypothetical protein
MAEIDRPLTDEERQLLVKTLAAHVIADQTGCSTEEANNVLARLAARGQLGIEGDATTNAGRATLCCSAPRWRRWTPRCSRTHFLASR